MKTECNIVRDLLPLYLENMVSDESSRYISNHLDECPACQKELERMKAGEFPTSLAADSVIEKGNNKSFQIIMKRMNRQFHSLAYSLIIFFIFLGFGWTGGENLMYNSLIMPIVGIFGYYVFRWRAVYKMPLLLLFIDLVVFAFGLVEIDFYSTIMFTLIYSAFVFVGIAIAFLIHFAFGREMDL